MFWLSGKGIPDKHIVMLCNNIESCFMHILIMPDFLNNYNVLIMKNYNLPLQDLSNTHYIIYDVWVLIVHESTQESLKDNWRVIYIIYCVKLLKVL